MFIALGLSMDAFAVAVTEGLRKNRASYALAVAVCFGVFQTGMAIIGYFAGSLFADYVVGFSNWIAFGLLFFIGGRMFWSGIQNKSEEEEKTATGFWSLIMLGVATSIDSLAVGVNFALSGSVNIWFASGVIGITTFLISLTGVYFGKLLGKFLAKYAEIAGGIILIVIGVSVLLG